jgi:prepilin-type N-terminal cleavage/methylation domain-containing protein
MKMLSRHGFTLLELMITVAVIAIVSSITLRSTYTFLQEQKLRQAANEFVSYLLTARAKALREASVSEKACEVQLKSVTNSVTVETTSHSLNICNGSSGLPALNLSASGGSNLTVSDSTGSQPFFITFTRMGTVASSNLSSDQLVTLPRVFYLSNTGATQMQRCVMIDLNSLRIGWRNSPTQATAPCIYNGN